MTSRSRKSLLFLLVAALAGALFFVAFRPHPVAVDIATATRGPLQVTINADGKTRIRHLYEVSAPISGTALRSPVAEGNEVIGGQTVVARVEPVAPALIDSRTRLQLEAAISEAEAASRLATAQLRQADEELAFAQRDFERTQALVERGVASLTTLENGQQVLKLRLAAREAAASNVDMAQSSLARAKAALVDPNGSDDTKAMDIVAPISGVVLSITQISEHAVQVGAPLMSIGAVGDLEITADLLSSDAVGLTVGARALVERWGGTPALEAQLTSLAPKAETHVSSLGIEEQRVSAVFDLLTPPEGRIGLGHQYAVFLRVITWEDPDVLRAPISALFRDGPDWAVFTVQGNVAKVTHVEIGHRAEDLVEITGGLNEGDQVITHPSNEVAEGVTIVERTTL
ncbi:efflux RND transporter periplasmic adaptor subunit [Celeribacter arenosi]|uniref:HlyD family efflux transporter periplasmic adaptor subunit n=1 Tax=Celeribacter arenosi TaxID=792649 RepID=A0ABP7K991_9RHOB